MSKLHTDVVALLHDVKLVVVEFAKHILSLPAKLVKELKALADLEAKHELDTFKVMLEKKIEKL